MRMRLVLLLLMISLLFSIPALAETVTPASDGTGTTVSEYTPDELLQQWYQLGAKLRKAGNYPFTELSKGDTGTEVTALQTQLAELGFYQKKVVDNFGSGTYNALRAFEKANSLKVDGIASVEDQKLMFSGNAIANTEARSASSSTSQKKNTDNSDATSGATK